MATIVVEALLSAPVEMLLEKIVSGEFMDFFRRTKLDYSLLEKLKFTLLSLQAVLNDAEEKQITNPAVKEWLVMLRDAVFEAEDLFDEINTEALRCKVKAEYESQTSSAKVRNIFSSLFKRFNRGVNSKMQTLYGKLEHLRKQKPGLEEGVSSSVWHGTPIGPVVGDKSSICGRDNDLKRLKEFLLSEEVSDSGSRIGVVSIVGMGGLGKTTLAELLYNDPEVEDKFKVKGWAPISQDFDVVRVTKTLVDQVTSEKTNNDNLNSDLNKLQLQLRESLSDKTFLLVLDDIWYGGYVGWNSLSNIFNVGGMGSKIIITTRDERVALPMLTLRYVHHLKPLEPEDCWSLISRHAFVGSNDQQRSNLEVIGREIAKKCDGLPLAAIALGGLLRTNLSKDKWNEVLKSSIWELTNAEVQPALLLSYRYLSAHLKGCLAYCSIFPKNSIFKKKMVVQLWIAEGLVRHPESQKSWEKVGGEYFDELVSRSLIHQRSIDDGEANFEMHDLINDLVTMITSPYSVRLDEQKLHERVRHLSYKRGEFDSYNRFDKFYALKHLRTFLSLPLQEPRWLEYSVSDKVVNELLPAMKQLHVLSLSNYMSITELPKAIGNLVYLRYFNLSRTQIKMLPPEICNLYNLQTLLLSDCRYLSELPKDIGKLVNLRHLDITGTSLREMPAQIAQLENLQTLSDFVVGKQHDGLKVAELGKFLHLEGKLSISALHNVTEPSDAIQASLKTKEQVCELDLKWDWYDSICTQGLGIQGRVLEQLQPSTNLKKLGLYGYGGTSFPNWLGHSSFGNMVYLCISDCRNCSLLPPFGQLGNLKKLVITGMKSVKSVGAEFYGSGSGPSFQPFPSLESLSFCGMPEWEEWNLIGGTAIEFPCLRNLSVLFCPKLKGNIPNNLPSLTELVLWSCPRLKGNVLNDLPSLSGDSGDEVLMTIEEISQWVLPLNSLQHLTIKGFPSLKYFPRDGLPKTLKSLRITSCENLEFLARESLHNYTSLEDVKLFHSCCSMTTFTLGSLPVLKHLLIFDCQELKSILIAEDASQQSLSFLRSITIRFCDELESFPPGGLPTPNLTDLELYGCKKLHSLPEPMNTLIGLQELRINYLTNLQSFPKEGFPINIRKLALGNLGGIMQSTSIAEWGFERLTCLDTLRIADDAIVEALMKIEVPLLPASLVSLEISHLYGIERLDVKWLQHLTSLKELKIHGAYCLKSLSEEGLLPSSLSVLRIEDCPLLEARWRRKRGKEWRKVAHIPSIIVNKKVIT